MSFEDGLVALLPRLRRFAAALARHPADTDDLCQLTLERALRSRTQWQQGTRLDSWLYRIMRNIWIDQGRASARNLRTFAAEEAGLAVGHSGGQEEAVQLGDIGKALGRLPDEQREAVVLVMVEGYTYKEAAEIVGCPVGTMNSRLVRGRDALLALLGEAA